MIDVSYLSAAPEMMLVLGAVAVLMVDVFAKPPPRVHGWITAAAYLAAGASIVLQWQRLGAGGGGLSFGGALVLDPWGGGGQGGPAGRGGVGHPLRLGDAGRAGAPDGGRGQPGAGSHRRFHADGRLGGPGHGVHSPRNRFYRPLRAGRDRAQLPGGRRGGDEVFPAGRLRFGHLHLRGGAGLRRDRRHQPVRHRAVPERLPSGPPGGDPHRHGPPGGRYGLQGDRRPVPFLGAGRVSGRPGGGGRVHGGRRQGGGLRGAGPHPVHRLRPLPGGVERRLGGDRRPVGGSRDPAGHRAVRRAADAGLFGRGPRRFPPHGYDRRRPPPPTGCCSIWPPTR